MHDVRNFAITMETSWMNNVQIKHISKFFPVFGYLSCLIILGIPIDLGSI